MSKILRDLTDDCYLEYKPEWTTDVFRWDGQNDYIEVGNIDEDFEYTFRMTGHIKIPWQIVDKGIGRSLVAYQSLLKQMCIDWHESKV